MTSRPTIEVSAAAGGWPAPWPNVAELADVFPSTNWTLIGGLMVQLHAVHHRLAVIRPTNDVDIVLHIESTRGVPTTAANSLESLGYRLAPSIDPRSNTAHRFIRGEARVDLVSSATDSVDVLMAEPSLMITPRGVRSQAQHVKAVKQPSDYFARRPRPNGSDLRLRNPTASRHRNR